MTAIFRDDLSTFILENVENIQLDENNGKWSVMFEDYEVREIDAQLIEVNQD